MAGRPKGTTGAYKRPEDRAKKYTFTLYAGEAEKVREFIKKLRKLKTLKSVEEWTAEEITEWIMQALSQYFDKKGELNKIIKLLRNKKNEL